MSRCFQNKGAGGEGGGGGCRYDMDSQTGAIIFIACEHQVDRHRHGHHDARWDKKNATGCYKNVPLSACD